MEVFLSIALTILSNTRRREWIAIGAGLILEGLVLTILPLAHLPSCLTKILSTCIPLMTIILWGVLIFVRLRIDTHSFLQVLWDKKGRIYCPNCKKMLVQTQEKCKDDPRIHALRCMNKQCNQESIFLRNDKGQAISIRLAKKWLADKLKIEIELDPTKD